MKKHMTIPFFIPNLGCPHMCIFCNQGASTGVRAVPRHKDVADKISQYISSPSAEGRRVEAGFFGGSFTSVDSDLQEELLSAAFPFLEKKLITGIRVSARPDALGHPELDLLKKYGVTTIEIGAQSFNDRVLELSERGHTVNDIVSASKLIKSYGFNLVIQIMTGLPGESRDAAIDSAMKAAGLCPSGVRIYPVIVIEDTPLGKLYKRGKYRALTLEDAVDTVKEQIKIFREADIPVIRIGVHPFSEAESGSIIAGPFHPAFGFLVKSSLMLDELRAETGDYLAKNPGCSAIRISLPEKLKEEYIGHKRSNVAMIKTEFSLKDIRISFHKSDLIKIEKSNQNEQ